LTKYFFRNPEIVQGKTVLEIGAGGGLPSLVAAHLGAKRTILTDYPDNSLIDNLKHNVETNRAMYPNADITVQPLLWGTTTDLNEKFDLIILSDLLNNHSAHEAMLETCEIHAHKKDTLMLVSFTHHQPWKAHKNMKFFDIAKRKGFSYEKMFEEKYPVMFEKDPGDEEVRRTVHVYSMRLN
jgi:nicotinamide N-methyltransferase